MTGAPASRSGCSAEPEPLSGVSADTASIPSAVWITNEAPPRRLIISGTSAVDHDVLVAEFEDGSKSYRGGKAHWIVKASGFVCGIAPFDPETAVYAHPATATPNPDEVSQ
jgi:hypothetical protein